MDETTFQPAPKALEAFMAETRNIGFQSWCWLPVGALLRRYQAHRMWPPEHAAKIPPLMEALATRQDFRRIYIDWLSGVVVVVKLAK